MRAIDWGARIVHRDNRLVVVDKPPGVPVQPDKTGDPSAIDALERLLERTVKPVHRIDRPVGGLVVFALDTDAAAALSAQFASGSVLRTYHAIVHGTPEENGELVDLITTDKRRNKTYVVQAGTDRHGDAQESRLSFHRISQGERYALVEISLATGRHHQIRAQLAAAGHPVRGDVKYGARRGLAGRMISLYATELTFEHPSDRRPTTFGVRPTGDSLWQTLSTGTDSQGG